MVEMEKLEIFFDDGDEFTSILSKSSGTTELVTFAAFKCSITNLKSNWPLLSTDSPAEHRSLTESEKKTRIFGRMCIKLIFSRFFDKKKL